MRSAARSLVALTLLATAALVLACSSSESDKYPSPEAMCAARAKAECAQVATRCLTNPESCERERKVICMTVAGIADAAGRIYTPSMAEECITKTESVYAKAVLPKAELDARDEACERVFQGKGERNSACTTSYACKGTLLCDKGFCAEKKEVPKGEQCGNAGQLCAAGSYCASQGGLMLCVDKLGADQICDATKPCKEDLRCKGICEPRRPQGDSCDTDDDCLPAAPLCEPSTKKCAAGLAFGPGATTCADYGAE